MHLKRITEFLKTHWWCADIRMSGTRCMVSTMHTGYNANIAHALQKPISAMLTQDHDKAWNCHELLSTLQQQQQQQRQSSRSLNSRIATKCSSLLHLYLVYPARFTLLNEGICKLMEALCGDCVNTRPHLTCTHATCQQSASSVICCVLS